MLSTDENKEDIFTIVYCSVYKICEAYSAMIQNIHDAQN
jgi:hypothetical protein